MHFQQRSCKICKMEEGNETVVTSPAVYSFAAPSSYTASANGDETAVQLKRRPSRYRKFQLKTLGRPSHASTEHGADASDDNDTNFDEQCFEPCPRECSPTTVILQKPPRKSKSRKKSIKDFMGERIRHTSGGGSGGGHSDECKPKSTARFTVYGDGSHTPASTNGSSSQLRPSTTMAGSTRSGTATTSTSMNSCSGESDHTFCTADTSSNSSFHRGVAAAATSRSGKLSDLVDPFHLINGDVNQRQVLSRQSRIPLRERKAGITSHPHTRAQSQYSATTPASPLPNLSLEQKLELAASTQIPSESQPSSLFDSSREIRTPYHSSSNPVLSSRSGAASPLFTPHSRAGSVFEARHHHSSRLTRPRLTPIHPARLGSPLLAPFPTHPSTPSCTSATTATFGPISSPPVSSVASPVQQSPISGFPYVPNPLSCEKTPPSSTRREADTQRKGNVQKPGSESSDEPTDAKPPDVPQKSGFRNPVRAQGFGRKSCVIAAGSGLGATAIDEDVPDARPNDHDAQNRHNKGARLSITSSSSSSGGGGGGGSGRPISQSRPMSTTKLKGLLSLSASNSRSPRRSSVPPASLLSRSPSHPLTEPLPPSSPPMASPEPAANRSGSLSAMEVRPRKANLTRSKSKSNQLKIAGDVVGEDESGADALGVEVADGEHVKQVDQQQGQQQSENASTVQHNGSVRSRCKSRNGKNEKNVMKRVWERVKPKTRK